jgi:tetratricopeptide (TPR) repeat protein
LDEGFQHRYRAVAYKGKAQYDLAIADCNKAIDLRHNYARAFYTRACTYKLQGKKDETIADLEKITTPSNDLELIEITKFDHAGGTWT